MERYDQLMEWDKNELAEYIIKLEEKLENFKSGKYNVSIQT